MNKEPILLTRDLKVSPKQVQIRVLRDYDEDFAGIEVEVDNRKDQ